MDILSGPLFLGYNVPFGRPSASFENSFILSFCLTITTASLSDPVQNTTPEDILSLCWCSLVLTLTTSMCIWHSAGATKSLSSVLSLFCSSRISLCIWPNYDSGGWATRIIPFSLSVFSTVSINLIRQGTIHFGLQMNADSYSEIYLLLSFEQSVWVYCINCVQNPRIIELESPRCAGKISELSSLQPQRQKAWADDCDKHRYHLAGWFRAYILNRIKYIIVCLLSFRIRCAVVSNISLSPISGLNADEIRTYSDAS